MADLQKLQFNNRTVIYPGHSGYIAFDIPKVYNVTTSGTNGSVTASPTEGITGTKVTLSNTPDSGYKFSSYTVTGTGASLSGNTLTIGTSDVSVVGNFTALGTVIYSNTGSKTSGSFSTGSLSTSSTYIAIKFDYRYNTGYDVNNYMIWRTESTNNIAWIGHARRYGVRNLHKFFRSSSGDSWNCFNSPTLGPSGLNSENNYYLNASSDTAKPYKVIFDRSAYKYYNYIDGELIFSGSYTGLNPLNFTVSLQPGTSSNMTLSNFTIYACNSLDDAQAI